MDTHPSQVSDVQNVNEELISEALNDMTIVIKKAPKPSIPPPTAPLVVKEISGGIRLLQTVVDEYTWL